jgi:hypothetical protein
VIERQRTDVADFESEAISAALQHRVVAFTTPSEPEVVTDYHVVHTELTDQKVLDHRRCRNLLDLFVERQADHAVDSRSRQQRDLSRNRVNRPGCCHR